MDTTKPGIEDIELVRQAKDGGVWVNLIDRLLDLFAKDTTTPSHRRHLAKIILTDSHLTLLEIINGRPYIFIYNLGQFKIAQEHGKDFIVLFGAENVIIGEKMGDCLITVEQNGKYVEVGATLEEIEQAKKSDLQSVELLNSEPRTDEEVYSPYMLRRR